MKEVQKGAILAYLDNLKHRHIRLKRAVLYVNEKPACFAGHVAVDFLHGQFHIPASDILVYAFGISRNEATRIIHANDVGEGRPEDGIRECLDLLTVSE